MTELFADALKFGGAVMIRRIVGIAHVDDFKDIKEDSTRWVTALHSHSCCCSCTIAPFWSCGAGNQQVTSPTSAFCFLPSYCFADSVSALWQQLLM